MASVILVLIGDEWVQVEIDKRVVKQVLLYDAEQWLVDRGVPRGAAQDQLGFLTTVGRTAFRATFLDHP